MVKGQAEGTCQLYAQDVSDLSNLKLRAALPMLWISVSLDIIKRTSTSSYLCVTSILWSIKNMNFVLHSVHIGLPLKSLSSRYQVSLIPLVESVSVVKLHLLEPVNYIAVTVHYRHTKSFFLVLLLFIIPILY